MDPEMMAQLPEHYLLASVIFAGAAKSDKDLFEKDAPAFGYTIKNRSIYRNKPIRDVILSPNQYYEVGSNEQAKFFMSKTNPESLTKEEQYYVKRSLQLAKAVIEGRMEDPTNGADMAFKPEDPTYESLSKKFGSDSVDPGNNYYEQKYKSGAHEYYREQYKPYPKKKQKPSTRDIQTGLQYLDYNVGDIDGKYGPMTTEAVIQFQIDNGLEPDGIAGKNTWKVMQNILTSDDVIVDE